MSLAQLEANRLCNIQGTKEYEQAQSVKGLLTKWAGELPLLLFAFYMLTI